MRPLKKGVGWELSDVMAERPYPLPFATVTRPCAQPVAPVADRPPRFRKPPEVAMGRSGARLPDGLLPRLARLVDISVLTVLALIALAIATPDPMSATLRDILPVALMIAAAIAGTAISGAYRFQTPRTAVNHLIRVSYGGGAGIAVACSSVWALFGRDAALLASASSLAAWATLLVLHTLYVLLIRTLARRGRLNENVVLVGATPNARRLIARNAKTRGLNLVGIFDDRLSRSPETIDGVSVLGCIDDLLNWDRLPEVDRIVITVTSDARARVRSLIDRLRILPQRVVLLLDLDGFNAETASLAEIAHSPAAYVSGRPDNPHSILLKKLTDLVLASLLLVVFSPLLLATALVIRLESDGPVLFRQRRHGFNNQIIRVWKFRSMWHDPKAEEHMTHQARTNDPRITGVGRVIRRTSIDELPQLINVLKGEMSLVGPRPHAVGMTADSLDVHAIVSDYAHRHRVKPGITGWAQVNGSRGPMHSAEEVRERVRLDLEYVNRASLWFDLYILLRTVPCLLGDRKCIR